MRVPLRGRNQTKCDTKYYKISITRFQRIVLILNNFGSPVNSCVSMNQNLQNPCLYRMLPASICLRLQASPVYASITIPCLKPQTAYGPSSTTKKNREKTKAESSLLEPTPNREPSSLLEWPRCEGGRAKLNSAELHPALQIRPVC